LNEKLNEKLNRMESVRSRDDDGGGCGEARARGVCVNIVFVSTQSAFRDPSGDFLNVGRGGRGKETRLKTKKSVMNDESVEKESKAPRR